MAALSAAGLAAVAWDEARSPEERPEERCSVHLALDAVRRAVHERRDPAREALALRELERLLEGRGEACHDPRALAALALVHALRCARASQAASAGKEAAHAVEAARASFDFSADPDDSRSWLLRDAIEAAAREAREASFLG